MCHQAPANTTEKSEWGTQLPACHLLVLVKPLWEKQHHNMRDSRVWGLLKGLHLAILGHADLGLREGHKVFHLSMTSRNRQTLSTDTHSPSLQREDLAAYLFIFCKGTQLTLYLLKQAPKAGGHPDPCTAAHSCAQAPAPQGPESTAHLKAYSSDVGFRERDS